ncbi:CRISPR-associated exonuclease Cas4/endonuclease Cas1 fusion [Nocardia camponoti]|uniref:CRISPR-associated endonuclease Cas1 n=2 Tax=Nocardia camponoti TaxID=1616106 RepID=A0A917VCR0_9NOCA|nr:CRISPR-associated exonuclease Cas4/endonuclease Cas1 fusion [Nocardia camponoti]
MEAIPISLVAHQVFCPRRAWLEAAGETTDTYQMAVGVAAHKGVDNPATARLGAKRALDVAHRELGLVGRIDVIDDGDRGLRLVEYKATPVRKVPEVTEAMRVQLALQSECLTDMGHDISECGVYFTSHEKFVSVEMRDEDLRRAREYLAATRATVGSASAPEPLEDDPKCMRCSHAGVCLPDERAQQTVVRRIKVADPDANIVHLATPGSRASVTRGRMRVQHRGEEIASVPLERVQGLVVHGNIDLSGALIRELLWRKLAIVWCSGTGRVVGWSSTAQTPNGLARVRQHEASAQGRLALAREFIAGKIANQATLLRRNGADPDVARYLRVLQCEAVVAPSLEMIFGVEGEAAARYFAVFPKMLRAERAEWFTSQWSGRSGRHATDPLNVALNYTYGILVAETIRAIAACGLDPHAGFIHSSNRNKPALALDLMEEFRAPLADAVVVAAINNGELKKADFSLALGSARLRDSGRKALIAAYERRISTEFTHPTFGYKITWRRAIEVQARMILGFLDGTQSEYAGIVTR